MDRLYLLAPALMLAASMLAAFIVYCGLYAMGRLPPLAGVKHNQLFGPFMASYLAWMMGPIERVLIGRVSPNAVTALSLAMCALTGIAAGLGQLAAAVWLFAFAGIFDVLDGRLARLAGKQTASGALFDSVSDRWGELFAFAGYAWFLRDTPWLLAVLGSFGASMMVSYTRARAEGLGIELSGGMMQRAERMVLVTGGTFVAVLYGSAEAIPSILGITMLICATTSTATALNRWIIAFRILARREAEQVEVAIVEEQPAQVAPLPPVVTSISKTDLRKVRPVEQH